MRTIISIATLCLLVANCAFMASLIRNEFRAREDNTQRVAHVPKDSSLSGLDASGNVATPDLDAKGRLKRNGHLLLFVIDKNQTAQDVEYWNRVIESTRMKRQETDAPIQYWGVCNGGIRC